MDVNTNCTHAHRLTHDMTYAITRIACTADFEYMLNTVVILDLLYFIDVVAINF